MINLNLCVPMQEVDDEARVGEALTKTIISALKTTPSLDNRDSWLNPTEVFTLLHLRHFCYLPYLP